MQKLGAFQFRLGRRLVRIWRWVNILKRSRKRGCNGFLKFKSKSKSQSIATRLISWLTCGASTSSGGDYYRIGDENPHTLPPPPPKGQLAVYVGGKREGGSLQRFLVPVVHFNHPLFGELLRESEAEFGFQHPGGITLPCPVSHFERVRTRIALAGRCASAAR